jgi:hypothetical protein
MVANEATKDAIWLRHLLDEMGIVQKGPMKICCDNQSYMALTRNPEFHGRTKHIKIQMDYIRSKVESGEVEFIYCHTKEMVADIFTKSLPKLKLKFCKENFCVHYQKKRKRKSTI